MAAFREELHDAVDDLSQRYASLQESARLRLGRLYNAADYPPSLSGLFAMSWDFPSVEPPESLRWLSPDVYDRECQRVQARFDEAVGLAEQAFQEELAKLIEHLAERLSGQTDGKPKVFRDSAVTNLTEFFARFRRLNVRSHEQLDELVERAEQLIQGVRPQQLRERADLREQVAGRLSGLQSLLDGLLIDRPRRNIQRRAR